MREFKDRSKVYDSLTEQWKRMQAREAAKPTKAKAVGERHDVEKAALNDEARRAKQKYQHDVEIERSRVAALTGVAKPADMDKRHKDEGEKIDKKFAEKREALKARHAQELAAARAEDARGRK